MKYIRIYIMTIMLMNPGAMVKQFKRFCIELVLWDKVLVRSLIRRIFSSV